MIIERIYIENFRSIRKLYMKDLGNLVVFVGENNSGKSTVLNAIRMFYNYEVDDLKLSDIFYETKKIKISITKKPNNYFYASLRELLKKNKHKIYEDLKNDYLKQNRRIGSLVFNNDLNKMIRKHFFNRTRLEYINVLLEFDNETLTKMYSVIDTNTTSKVKLSKDDLNMFLSIFLETPAIIEDERGFKAESENDSGSITNQVFRLFINTMNSNIENSNLDKELENRPANELTIDELNYLLKKKIEYESDEFLENINKAFKSNYSSDLEIKWNFNSNIIQTMPFSTRFYDLDKETNADFLSVGSGTRSIFVLSLFEAYVNSNKNPNQKGLFLIEEPELYLYPKLEERMGSILSRLSENNQVFITTHSGGIVSYFNEESIFKVELVESNGFKNSKYTKLGGITEVIKLLGFNSYPFFKKKYIVFVEGPNDVKVYKKIFQKLYPENSDDVAFLLVAGERNMRINLLVQLLQSTELKSKFSIFVDADGRCHESIKNQYKNMLEQSKILGKTKNFLNDRIYITENSTNIETITYSYDNFENIERMKSFIKENEKALKDSIIERKKHKILSRDICELKAYDELCYLDAEAQFIKLKSFFLTKTLHKKFNQISKFKPLYQHTLEEIEILTPDLISKFAIINDHLNSKI